MSMNGGEFEELVFEIGRLNFYIISAVCGMDTRS